MQVMQLLEGSWYSVVSCYEEYIPVTSSLLYKTLEH